MTFLFFCWVELTFVNENLVATRRMIKFLVGWGTPRMGLPLYMLYIYIYKTTLKVAILLLKTLSTLCVTDIYGIFTCLFSVGNTVNLSLHEHI